MTNEVEDRQERERRFHDDLFAAEGSARDETGRFYAVVESSQRHYWDLVEGRSRDADCVEYGCATGTDTIRVAATARAVTGLDVSPVAIDRARARTAHLPNASFEVVGAEGLPFENASFDLAFGNSVLHHLDLEPAIREMARVLRPGGSAVFSEPLGHNELINWYRRRTPEMRTPDEHPLLRSDIKLFARHFDTVEVEFFNLTSLGAVLLAGRLFFSATLRVLDRLDHVIMTVAPPLRYYAWVCVTTLGGPRQRS